MKAPALLFSLCISIASAQTFKTVDYYYQQAGKDKADQVSGSIAIDAATKSFHFQSKKVTVDLTADAITKIIYERASKPRYATGLLIAWPLLFTKSKQHYLTIQYMDGDVGKYAVFRLDKGNYREVLAAVESATGKTIEREEER